MLRRLLISGQTVAENATLQNIMRHQLTLIMIDTIARAGSIRKAAEILAITPSALNRRLLAVEEELGVLLFERKPRGVTLSAAGELFVAHCRRQFSELERIRSQIEDLKGARWGSIALGLDDSLPAGFIEADIARYRADHPGVSFSLVTTNRSSAGERIEDYSLDLAVVIEPEKMAGLTTLATLPLRVNLVVAANHEGAHLDEIPFLRALEYPLVLPPEDSSLAFVLDIAADRFQQALPPMIRCPSYFRDGILLESNLAGLEFSVADSASAAASDDGLSHVPIRYSDIPPAQVHLVQRQNRALPVAAAKVAMRLQETFERLSGEG